MNILFVCTGNTCRSPMAEGLLKKKMPRMNVQSAGVFAGYGNTANGNAIKALREQGVDLDHKSQPVTDKLLDWADIVLAMTTQHKQSLILDFPDHQNKYYTLKEYVAEADINMWKEIRRAYADYEMKRSLLIREKGLNLDDPKHASLLERLLEGEMGDIKRMESNLINYDISDPFGGDIQTYRNTLAELNEAIDLLIEKIEK